MVKLSVIIPVYNAEKYLGDCLDSILSQSLKDIEVICVDDGSTDSSLDILQEYASRDDRVKVLQQQNRYAGVARNTGVKVASGLYLHFMDADDILVEGAYEKLEGVWESQNYPNIIRFKAQAFDNNTCEYVKNNGYEMVMVEDCLNSVLDVKTQLEKVFMLAVPPWLGIVKKEFLFANGLEFNSLRCCNDRSFFMSSALVTDSIYLADVLCVKHRVNNMESLIGIRHKNFSCNYNSVEIIKTFCESNCIDMDMARKVVLNELSDVFVFYHRFFKKEGALERFKNLSEFVKNFDKNFISDDIKDKWYYYDWRELLNISSRFIWLRFLIKRYVLNILPASETHRRVILFNTLKFKVKK